MKNSLRFLPVVDSQPEIKYTIARGVFELDHGFYGNLFPEKEICLNKIFIALNEPGSDLGCGFVAYYGDNAVGYLSYFPVAQKTTRNLATLKSFFDLTKPDSRNQLRTVTEFQRQLAPLTINGFYLNKILIFPERQGLSFGYKLFNHYLQAAENLRLAAVFHVKKDNTRAIEFYNRQGFAVQGSDHEYLLCIRE